MKVGVRSANPLLSVSIVVYRTPPELLRGTLESLELAARELAPVVVTLVDNASGAPYLRQVEALVAALPARAGFRVRLLSSGANRGYGAGHNLALGEVGQYHLVLNPDVELAPDCLRVGLDYLAGSPSVALLNPRAAGGGGEQEFLCKRYPSVLVLALRACCPAIGRRLFPESMARYEMRELAGASRPREVELASGCFMLMRSDLLLATGAFNERFFLYFEDFDLSLRMARSGRVEYHPGLHIVHHGGYAARKGLKHLRLFAASAWRFFHLHGWRWI